VVEVSNADRVVFPEVGRTKGDVVAYYERVARRLLPHVVDRPLSIRRYPKGLSGAGFFQKNVPRHYPESIRRLPIAREKGETVYPIVERAGDLAYLANQGAIELHVPTARASNGFRADRLVIDLDPPPGAFGLVRRAALLTRDALGELGLETVPVATGSKGYHVVSAIEAAVDAGELAITIQKFAALLVKKHPDDLTGVFRVALRGGKVFVDWMRNAPLATVVVPYSLRATPRATVAAPLSWDEIEALGPDAFGIADAERLLERPDTLADLAAAPGSPVRFARAVDAAFEQAGLVLEPFNRFRA
jgi:bifunctional non-homologous end joining protein LigD